MENQQLSPNPELKSKKWLWRFFILFKPSSFSRYLIPILVLLIVLSSTGFYLYKRQKSSADLNVRDIFSNLRGRILYAAACQGTPEEQAPRLP